MDPYNNYNDDFFFRSKSSEAQINIQGQSNNGSQQVQSSDNSQREQVFINRLPQSVPIDASENLHQGSVDCYTADADSAETNSGSKLGFGLLSFLIAGKSILILNAVVLTLFWGVIFFAAPFFTVRYLIKSNSYDLCPAEVTYQYTEEREYTDIDGMERTKHIKHALCSYDYNGKWYQSMITASSSFEGSESIEIYVNPESPEDFMIKQTSNDLTLSIIRDVILILVGIFIIRKVWRDNLSSS